MTSRWAGQPPWVRRTVLAVVVLLFYGAAVHAVQLVAGRGSPYPHLPDWLALYFISLTAVDPVAAVLLARRRRSGVVLTAAVLVSDAAANTLANYAYDDAVGVTAGRVGQAVITLLAAGVLAVTPTLWRACRARG